MKRSEYEAKLKSLTKQIEELKKVEIEEDGFWIPKMDEEYWFISSYADVDCEYWFISSYADVDCEYWLYYSCDKDRLSIGNVFQTKEESLFELERLKVIAELKRFSRNFEIYKNKYCIKYDMISKNIDVYNNYGYATGELRFASEKDAKDAIEFVGEDRVLKYYLGVEE